MTPTPAPTPSTSAHLWTSSKAWGPPEHSSSQHGMDNPTWHEQFASRTPGVRRRFCMGVYSGHGAHAARQKAGHGRRNVRCGTSSLSGLYLGVTPLRCHRIHDTVRNAKMAERNISGPGIWPTRLISSRSMTARRRTGVLPSRL